MPFTIPVHLSQMRIALILIYESRKSNTIFTLLSVCNCSYRSLYHTRGLLAYLPYVISVHHVVTDFIANFGEKEWCVMFILNLIEIYLVVIDLKHEEGWTKTEGYANTITLLWIIFMHILLRTHISV